MPGHPVEWKWYHRPSCSLTVVRRRAGEELLEMIALYGDAMLSRGRTLVHPRFRPSSIADRMVTWRLRKAGLLVLDQGPERPPELALSPDWKPRDLLRPVSLWRQRWGGVWFVLMYDIAESDRRIRNTLRGLLKRLRMGRLQQSVWISPRDIRPEFADLIRATGLGLDTCLFESRTVMGQTDADLVRKAWNWADLGERHAWYIEGTEKMLEELSRRRPNASAVPAIAREEMLAYGAALRDDPLLPAALLPGSYRGREVDALHRRFVRTAGKWFSGV